jgi:hypothetical protein
MDHQAFAQLLGNYGEFVGAIAVVVTLGYLTVQVRMSNKTQRAQTHQQIADARGQTLKLFLQHPDLDEAVSKVYAGQELSDMDRRLLRHFSVIVARHHENELYQHSLGMVDDHELESQRKVMLLPHIQFGELKRSIQLYSPLMQEEFSLLEQRKANDS